MDWLRTPTWSAADRDEFEDRLGRSQGQRAQHLLLKALALLSAGTEREDAGAEQLLARILDEHPDDSLMVSRAQHELGTMARGEGRQREALDHLRASLRAIAGTGMDNGSREAIVEIVIEARFDDLYEEASMLLDEVLAHGGLFFGASRFRYCVCRADLAILLGDSDAASVFAHAALYLHEHDRPSAPRHPDVGLIRAEANEIERLNGMAAGGEPRRYDRRVADYLSRPGTEIDWTLVSRLRSGKVADERAERREASHRAAEPVLASLSQLGLHSSHLEQVSVRSCARKADAVALAEALLPWYRRVVDPLVKYSIAEALDDPRVADIATRPLLDDFLSIRGEGFCRAGAPSTPELGEARVLKSALGRSLARLLRAGDFPLIESHISDPLQGDAMGYLYWAIPRMREARVVAAMIDLLHDDYAGGWALTALVDLRADQAEPHLARVASEHYPKGARGDEAAKQRQRVKVARRGLEKLAKARERGVQLAG